jgi:hypothetical protein
MTRTPTPGPLSADGWIDMAEAPHGVPILAQYHEFNDPSRSLAEHVVWFYANDWRPYPQTVGSAFADRWKHLSSGRLAPTAPLENPEEPCAPENAIDWPTSPVETLGPAAAFAADVVRGEGAGLHPATADLVDRFAAELKSKLMKAEAKYGYRDDWSKPDWKDDLIESLTEHVQKGDPRDVAAYCAFAWHHGWSTSEVTNHLTGPFSPRTENGQPAWADQDIEDLLSDAIGDSFDMDWTARDGAKAVLAALKREGLLVAAKPSEAPAGLTPAEQKTQGARCGCKGTDDMCPCQNTPDRQTIKDRSNA